MNLVSSLLRKPVDSRNGHTCVPENKFRLWLDDDHYMKGNEHLVTPTWCRFDRFLSGICMLEIYCECSAVTAWCILHTFHVTSAFDRFENTSGPADKWPYLCGQAWRYDSSVNRHGMVCQIQDRSVCACGLSASLAVQR